MSAKKVEAQLKAIENSGEFSPFRSQKDLKFLPEVIRANEDILAIISGTVAHSAGIIVCTSQRVVFLHKPMIRKLVQREISLENVTGISQKIKLTKGSIVLYSPSEKLGLKRLRKAEVPLFVRVVNEARGALGKPSKASKKTSDTLSQLEKLGELRDKGLLTDKEFSKQKAKILKGC